MDFCQNFPTICSRINPAFQELTTYTEQAISAVSNELTSLNPLVLPVVTGLGLLLVYANRSKIKNPGSPPTDGSTSRTAQTAERGRSSSPSAAGRPSGFTDHKHSKRSDSPSPSLQSAHVSPGPHSASEEPRETLMPDTTKKYAPIPEFSLLQVEEGTMDSDLAYFVSRSLQLDPGKSTEAVVAATHRNANLIWHFSRLHPALRAYLCIPGIERSKEDQPAARALSALQKDKNFMTCQRYLATAQLKGSPGNFLEPSVQEDQLPLIPTPANLQDAANTLLTWATTEGAPYFQLVEEENLATCYRALLATKKNGKLNYPPNLGTEPTENASIIRAWMKGNQEELSKIEWLDLSNQQLCFLPQGFLSQFKSLKFLKLEGNRFTHIPSEIFTLPQLQWLILENNQIHTLSPAIKNLGKLEELNLGGNNLTDLPNELGTLGKLGRLTLSNNFLTEFSKPLCQLTDLRDLYLNGNPISAVPNEISQMEALQHLCLFNSQVEGLPADLQLPSNLYRLDLQGTPLAKDAEKCRDIDSRYKGKIYFGDKRQKDEPRPSAASTASSSSSSSSSVSSSPSVSVEHAPSLVPAKNRKKKPTAAT